GKSNRRATERAAVNRRFQTLATSTQDAELFLFSAEDEPQLLAQVDRIDHFAARLSYSELTDLANELHRNLRPGLHRAALIATAPPDFARRLRMLRERLATDRLDGMFRFKDDGVFYGKDGRRARIGFLFPGQGAPVHLTGGLWRRRFPCVDDLYRSANLPAEADERSTAAAQPAIVASSLGALGVLRQLGIDADVAIGHSLGELTALHWADSWDAETLLRIARLRGRIMAGIQGPAGAMA